MFQPVQVIFAPTSRCNLSCSHCRVRRDPEELSAAQASAFLERCARGGIERVGFSGGEPFLRPDFLTEVSRTAVSLGLYFDRLMTNGDWFADQADLENALTSLYDAGFDGTFGLSTDFYHGQDPERLSAFLSTVFRIWGRKDCAEILSVRSPEDEPWLEGLRVLAEQLGGRLVPRTGEPRRIADAAAHGEEAAAGEILDIPILRFPSSASSVAVCCGFANENPSLIVGNIREDDFDSLMESARGNPHVRLVYEKGLDARRRELEASGVRFPGKTDDICFFCDYLFRNGLIGD